MIHETSDVEQLRDNFKNNKQHSFYNKNYLSNIFLNIHLYISNLFNSI